MWKIIPQDSTIEPKYSPFRGLVLTFASAKPFHYFEDYMWSVLLHFFAKSFRHGTGINVEELDLEELDLKGPNPAKKKRGWIESPLSFQEELRFQGLYGHVCVVHHDSLLVIGGQFGDDVYDTIHEIQLKEAPPYTSRLRSQMPRPKCYHGAVKFAGKVYIIGGMETSDPIRGGPTNTVLAFDPRKNTCTEMKSLPYPVSHMATTVWNDNVVVLGGKDNEGNVLNTGIMYNVTLKKAIPFPPMENKRYGCTAVTFGDNIIVMGGLNEGREKLNSVECYNAVSKKWTELPGMMKRRAYATAVKCDIPTSYFDNPERYIVNSALAKQRNFKW